MLVAFAFFFSHVALFQQGIFAEAATLGAEGFTVPNLSCFTLVNKDDMTAAESDLSGIAYDPETGHFFAVNNGDAKVYVRTRQHLYENSRVGAHNSRHGHRRSRGHCGHGIA